MLHLRILYQNAPRALCKQTVVTASMHPWQYSCIAQEIEGEQILIILLLTHGINVCPKMCFSEKNNCKKNSIPNFCLQGCNLNATSQLIIYVLDVQIDLSRSPWNPTCRLVPIGQDCSASSMKGDMYLLQNTGTCVTQIHGGSIMGPTPNWSSESADIGELHPHPPEGDLSPA